MNLTKWARLLLLPLLLLSACATSAARDALLPAMRAAWPPIRASIAREIAATASPHGVTLQLADAAIESGSATAIAAVDWPPLDALAEGDTVRREAAGAIGPGVAASIRRNNTRFAEARVAFTR
jgi:hypothetical protein